MRVAEADAPCCSRTVESVRSRWSRETGQLGSDRCPNMALAETEVAFGVLEVDGIDFVRHGGGAYFTGDGLLTEEAHGDVGPDVAVEVDEDCV